MAVYGTGNGTVPFTGYTNTLGTNPTVGDTAGSVAFNALTQHDDKIAYLLSVPGSRETRRLMLTLLGATAGPAAAETRRRRPGITALADPQQLGGLVSVETTYYINRATTAGDVTRLKAMIGRTPGPSSYPRDVSGNGGGQPYWG